MGFDEDDNCVGGLVPKFGAIFMSNGATKKECLRHKIFGLPMAKANFVNQVKSGMILFLFEFEKRELYGVFKATSDGTMNLNPRAFTSSGKQFPAQVQIAPIWTCRPLPEVVFRDAIKENYYSPNKFNFGLSAQQVHALLHLFDSRRLEEGKTNFGCSPGMGFNSPDLHWTKKRKMDDHGRFPSHEALESEVLDNCPPWHATSADCGGDTLGTINSASDSTFLLNSRFSTEEEGKANFGRSHGMGINSPDFHWTKKRNMDDDGRFPSHDALESEVLDKYPSWHATGGDCGGNISGTINSAADGTFLLNRRFSTEHIGNSLLGLVGADREPLVVEEKFKSVNNDGCGIEPDFLPVFPSYFTSCEDIVVANDYRFSKDDEVENACDIESLIRPSFTSGLVSNDALDKTVPYDPEFPDIQYQCSSQILDSAQDFSSHQVPDENFLPLSTSECVTHEAPLGSLYSEAPVVKASVFSRLSVAPRKHKKENRSIHNKDARVSSINEIMDSLHHSQNGWVKGSVRAKSRYVYVRCEDESKFLNQLQVEQPVVVKEMTANVDCLVEEECDVPKETRVVDFKRRSQKNKYLDKMISKDSAGTTMGRTLRTTVDAEDLAGKTGKKRKLIRPDFRKKQSHEKDDILRKFEGREKIDAINSQIASGANDCEQRSSLQMGSENQVNLPIQNLASSLARGSGAEEQPYFISGVTVVSKNLEEEETADINHQVGNVDITLEHKCSLQRLQLGNENQANLSIQDLASSLASGSSAQEQPSFIPGVSAVPKNLEEEETLDINHQVGGNVDISLEHKCSLQSLQLGSENQVNLSIKDLASSLASDSGAQEQPSFITGVAAVPKNFEEEETLDINHQVGGNVDITLEHKCSLQSLKLGTENQVNLSIKDLASSLASDSSAQEQPSFTSGVAADPKNLEGEEIADINHQVGNVDINLKHKCSLQSLEG